MFEELYFLTLTWLFLIILRCFGLCFDRIKLVSYTIWTLWSIGLYITFYVYDINYWDISTVPMIHTINFAFIYEMLFHPPDTAHTIHHLVTIILQCISLYSGFAPKSTYHIILCNTAQLGFFSSIFSSLRTISQKENWFSKQMLTHTYYVSYLIAKIGGIVLFYWYMYIYAEKIQVRDYWYVYVLYGMIHLIQLYFSSKIWKILSKKTK